MEIFGNIYFQSIMILVFLILSALFSSSETALFSLSRARLLKYRESSDRRHKAISELMGSYSYTLITLIFCNMLVNIALTLTSDRLFHQHLHLPPVYEQLITIVFAVLILLLFGEVAPKTIALIYSNRIADHIALPVLYLRRFLFPIIWSMDKCFTAILKLSEHQKPRALHSEEYLTYIKMSAAAGAFSKAEKKLLESVFELRQIIAEEVMSARVNLAPIRANTPPKKIVTRIKEKKQEFYPIIKKDIDDSERLLAAKDFFLVPPEERDEWLKSCTFPAILIPANVSLTQVLRTLNREKVPAALVVDEYGRTIGMISVKDIYIRLVGEVETIYDKAEFNLKQIGSDSWMIRGMIPLFELEDAFGIEIPEEYESNGLNGLFGEILGRLPETGDTIQIDNLKLTARKIVNCRVVTVIATKLKNTPKGDE